jgi:hypothetical protein
MSVLLSTKASFLGTCIYLLVLVIAYCP